MDTYFYAKTDPPAMTLQMPQILKKAGVKYIVQGRMAYGYYNWEAPDGSILLTYAYQYGGPDRVVDTKNDQGWLHYAKQRTPFYERHDLPPLLCADYTDDYLPPQWPCCPTYPSRTRP